MEGFGERRGGFRPRNRFGNAPKPVAVGDVLELTIEATGSRGDGIAKKDGLVIFVKGATQGQTVKAKITSVGRSSANAEVVGGETASSPAASEPESGDGEDIQ